MAQLSAQGEKDELKAIAKLRKKPKVHMKDDDCHKSLGKTHIGDTKCLRCGVIYGTRR